MPEPAKGWLRPAEASLSVPRKEFVRQGAECVRKKFAELDWVRKIRRTQTKTWQRRQRFPRAKTFLYDVKRTDAKRDIRPLQNGASCKESRPMPLETNIIDLVDHVAMQIMPTVTGSSSCLVFPFLFGHSSSSPGKIRHRACPPFFKSPFP